MKSQNNPCCGASASEFAGRPAQVYVNRLSMANRLGRVAWNVVYTLLFRPSPAVFHGWRRLLLRFFGAQIEQGVHVYPKARIWAPWNLKMAAHSSLANDVDCYNVAPVTVGEFAIVSQYSFICTATHNYRSTAFELITKPVNIGARAWVAADVFVAPGVTVGEGSVIGARSVVAKNVPPWRVCAGSPLRDLGVREITE